MQEGWTYQPFLLRAARERKKFSIDKAAKLMQKAPARICEWEGGKASPSMATLEIICNIYEVEPSFFFTRN